LLRWVSNRAGGLASELLAQAPEHPNHKADSCPEGQNKEKIECMRFSHWTYRPEQPQRLLQAPMFQAERRDAKDVAWIL
jgi:hypothetical protein